MEMLGNDAGTVRSIIYKLFGVMTARAQRRLGGGCELQSREDEAASQQLVQVSLLACAGHICSFRGVW